MPFVGAELSGLQIRLQRGHVAFERRYVALEGGYLFAHRGVVRLRRRQRGFHLGQRGLRVVQGGRRQFDLPDAGHLQLAVAGVRQRAGVADPANRDVGYLQAVGRHERQLGLRQIDGVGNELAGAAVDLADFGGGAAGVLEQGRVALPAVRDRRDVHGVGAGNGDASVGQAAEARIELIICDHDRGRLEHVGQQGIELGARRGGVGLCHPLRDAGVLGHDLRFRPGQLGGVPLRLSGIPLGSRGVRVGHRSRGLGAGIAGGNVRLQYQRFGSGQFGAQRSDLLVRGGRKHDAAQAGDLQLVAANVGQLAGVPCRADGDIGHHQLVRPPEHQPGSAQVDGIGNHLAVGAEDGSHRGGGSAGILEQRRIGLPVIHDRRQVDRIRTGQRGARAADVEQAGVELIRRHHHLGGMGSHRHHQLVGGRIGFRTRHFGVLHGALGFRACHFGIHHGALGFRARHFRLLHRRCRGRLGRRLSRCRRLGGCHRLLGLGHGLFGLGLSRGQRRVGVIGRLQRRTRCSRDCTCR